MTIALVAGHNGIITGASGNGYFEHTVARQMVSKVNYYLKQLGETVYICTDDVGKTQTQVWSNAVKNCNNKIGKNGRAISIHLNSSTNPTATGVEVLTITDNQMAAKLSEGIANVLGLRNRGVKDGSEIGFINSTKATACLIELCFISNSNDMKQLISKFDEVAKVIAEVLVGKKLNNKVTTATVTKVETIQTKEEDEIMKVSNGALDEAMKVMLLRFAEEKVHGDKAIDISWRERYIKGEMTTSDAIAILYLMMYRDQFDKRDGSDN